CLDPPHEAVDVRDFLSPYRTVLPACSELHVCVRLLALGAESVRLSPYQHPAPRSYRRSRRHHCPVTHGILPCWCTHGDTLCRSSALGRYCPGYRSATGHPHGNIRSTHALVVRRSASSRRIPHPVVADGSDHCVCAGAPLKGNRCRARSARLSLGSASAVVTS